MSPRHIPAFATAALLAGALAAQVPPGAPAPVFPFAKVANGGPDSFADFAGRVVILKFSETW
jgi:hypothetical protein